MPASVKNISNLSLIIALFATNSSPLVSEYSEMWEEEEVKTDETATVFMEMIHEEYSAKRGFKDFKPACSYLAEVLGKPVYKYSMPSV